MTQCHDVIYHPELNRDRVFPRIHDAAESAYAIIACIPTNKGQKKDVATDMLEVDSAPRW